MIASEQLWLNVCKIDDLVVNSGVCALVHQDTQKEQQVALFWVPADENKVYAIGNYDPIGKAHVLHRGLLGSAGGVLFVASPLYKQRFTLVEGVCLDDPTANVPIFPARISGDDVQLLV
ncbi:nitrite reductase small subunit NirD [Alteromonas flava]|uniref:nitrite reductase small subunit NirD n=1 Tax=Alteromonas flava TaxID=2048003 RepID=UPI00196B98BB|nr:nitrite reductase small subunit NirD [Alteromonas flava]